MKSFNSKTAGLSLLSAILLTACVDDKYDLSDIDTTVGLKVNDLVIPMNMDAITLKSVIDIKDGDDIQVINGEYAVIKDGDFTSSPVNISAIDMNAPAISNTSHNCALLPGTNTYDISSNASPFSYFTDQVTDCIVSIESVGTEWTLDINMSLHESDGGKAVSVNGSISDLKLRIPRGLTLKSDASSYDPKTGIYNAGNRRVTDGKLAIHLQAIGIDAATAGIKYDYATHTASLSDECAVTGGLLTLDNASSLPQLLRMNTSYSMSDIHVASFTGEIYGGYTDLPWGMIFVRDGQTLPAHPTQIYEALCYFALFGLLMWMYWKRNAEERPWLMTGVFFLVTFGARYLIEYVKNPQEAWEADMTLNMGQWLSLPFIALGIGLIVYAMTRPRQRWSFPGRFADEPAKDKK